MLMRKVILHIFITLSLVSFVSACSKQDPAKEMEGDEITLIAELAEMTKSSSAGLYEDSKLSSLGEFKVTGYDSDSTIFTDRSVFYVNNLWWKFKDNPTIWLRDHSMTFWANANLPSYATVSSSTKASATLSISGIPTSASSQYDPLIGYYSGKGQSGSAVIKFYHPLTAVRFKTGQLGGNPAIITGINSVTVKGVYQNAVANVTGSSTALSYSWTTRSGSIDVSGVFEGTSSKMPFILIPQSFSTITIDVNVTLVAGGATKTISTKLPAGEWNSGILYTYTLDYIPNKPIEESLKVTLTDWQYIKSDSGKDFFDADFDD